MRIIISKVQLLHFQIPFTVPLRMKSTTLCFRQGWLLALMDDQENVGIGEISPLEGFDHTPLGDCETELIAVKQHLTGCTLDMKQLDLTKPGLGLLPPPFPEIPHVLFGLESALIGLIGRQKNSAFQQLFPDLHFPLKIPVNGLFVPRVEGDARDSVATAALALKKKGCQTIKVKIGRLPAADEISQILDLFAAMGGDIILRLDANQLLNTETFQLFYDHLRHLPIEYVEEPTSDINAVTRMADTWDLALDESLIHYLDIREPDLSQLPARIKALIIKPGSFWGIHALVKLILAAQKQGIKMVLSSAFNTGITLSILALLTTMIPNGLQTAHGFDTLTFFKTDILKKSPILAHGALVIPRENFTAPISLNHSHINNITHSLT